MSLINKILRDLDARSTSRTDELSLPKTVYKGIRPVNKPFRPSRSRFTLGLIVTLILLGGVYGFLAMSSSSMPGAQFIAGIFSDSVSTKPGTAEPSVALKPISEEQAKPDVGQVAKPTGNEKTKKAKPGKKKTARRKKSAPVVAVKKPARRSAPGSVRKQVKPISNAERAENEYRLGANAIEQGNRPLAESRLQNAIELEPGHVTARELLVGVYLTSGRQRQAISTLREGLNKLPGHPRLTLLLARLLVEQGDNDTAIVVLEKAMKSSPADGDLASLAAAVYQRMQQHDKAIATYRKVLALRPGEGRWWIGLAISLESSNDNAAAGEAYRRALQTRLDSKLAQYARQRMVALKPN